MDDKDKAILAELMKNPDTSRVLLGTLDPYRAKIRDLEDAIRGLRALEGSSYNYHYRELREAIARAAQAQKDKDARETYLSNVLAEKDTLIATLLVEAEDLEIVERTVRGSRRALLGQNTKLKKALALTQKRKK